MIICRDLVSSTGTVKTINVKLLEGKYKCLNNSNIKIMKAVAKVAKYKVEKGVAFCHEVVLGGLNFDSPVALGIPECHTPFLKSLDYSTIFHFKKLPSYCHLLSQYLIQLKITYLVFFST